MTRKLTMAHDRVRERDLSGRRLLIYGMNYWPEFTSTGRYSGEIGASLAERGVRVEVVTTPPHYPGWAVQKPFRAGRYSSDHIGDVRVFRCPLVLRREMRGIWRLIAPLTFAIASTPVALWRLVRLKPDVLLCIEPTLFSAPIVSLAAKLLGVRTVLHVQDLEIDAAFGVGHLKSSGFLRRCANVFERMARRRFDSVVTISNAMRAKLAKKGVADSRLRIIRNWVNLDRIRPLHGANAYREKLGIAETTLVVEYAGSIGAKQALEVVLDAAERLTSERDIVFVIAGDGPAKARLMKQYAHLPNVRFLEPQPEESLCSFLNLADLHVIPQLAEAADLVLPSKLGGMLASGRPIVATVHPDHELGTFLGDAAILVPPGDSATLAEAIRTFAAKRLDDGADRRRVLAQALSSNERLADFAAVLFE